jgi:hypothetical protein
MSVNWNDSRRPFFKVFLGAMGAVITMGIFIGLTS